jgi:hypothetical protein
MYVPEYSLDLVRQKLLLFAATIGNLAFWRDGTDGAAGLSTALAPALPYPYSETAGEATQLVALLALIAATVWTGRRARWRLLVPGVWMAAYLAPTMITRNLQLYYYQEPLVGLAVGLPCAGRISGRRRDGSGV